MASTPSNPAAPAADPSDPAQAMKNMSKEQATRVFQNQCKMAEWDENMKPKMYPFEAGEVFLEEMPYLYTLNDAHKGKRCDCCFKSPESSNIKGVKPCSRCKFIFYCGKDCQKKDWKLHKNECLRIVNMDPNLVPKLVNALTRTMARAIDLDMMGESQNKSTFYKRSFWDLVSHSEDIKKDPERMMKVDLLVEVLEYFMKTPDPTAMLRYNRDKITELYGILTMNMHGATDQLSSGATYQKEVDDNDQLMDTATSRQCSSAKAIAKAMSDPGDEETGTCLYLDISRLDHSCHPNAAVYFLGTKAKVFILEDGKNEREDGIRNTGLSYLRIAYNVGDVVRQTPAADRREALKKKYYFDCDCGDCTSKDDATHFNARCPKCDHHQRCNMIQGPGASCGHQTTGEERTRHRDACESVLDKKKEIDTLLEAKDKEGIIAVVKSWPEFLKIPMRHLSPSDKHLFQLVMKMIAACSLVCPINFRTCLYKKMPEFNRDVLDTLSKMGKVLMKIMEMKRNEPLIGFYSQVFLAIAGAQKYLNLVDDSLESLRFFRDATRTMKGENSPYFRLLEAYIAEMNAKHFLKSRPASFKKKQIGRTNEEEADVLLLGSISRMEKLLGQTEYLTQLEELRAAIPLPEGKRAGE